MLPPIGRAPELVAGEHSLPAADAWHVCRGLKVVLSPNLVSTKRTPPNTVWALDDRRNVVGCMAGTNFLVKFPNTDPTPKPGGTIVGIAAGNSHHETFVATTRAIYAVTLAGRWTLLWKVPRAMEINMLGRVSKGLFAYHAQTGTVCVLRILYGGLALIRVLQTGPVLALSSDPRANTLYILQRETLAVTAYAFDGLDSAGLPFTTYKLTSGPLGLQASSNVQLVRGGFCIVFSGFSGGRRCISKIQLNVGGKAEVKVLWNRPWDSFVAMEDCVMVYNALDSKTTRLLLETK
jgi:hypothetical protein